MDIELSLSLVDKHETQYASKVPKHNDTKTQSSTIQSNVGYSLGSVNNDVCRTSYHFIRWLLKSKLDVSSVQCHLIHFKITQICTFILLSVMFTGKEPALDITH